MDCLDILKLINFGIELDVHRDTKLVKLKIKALTLLCAFKIPYCSPKRLEL